MAIRNFVLKLVQKDSGKRTHVTIEQEAGSGVESSPNVEYTFEKVDKSTGSVDILSFKRVDGGVEQIVGWSIGSVGGDGADLVVVRKRAGGVDILIGHNTYENAKSWSVTLTQEESGKTIELGGVINIAPNEHKYEFEAIEEFMDLKGYSYLYTVISLQDSNYVPFNVSVYGSGSDLVKAEIFNELNHYYLGVGISKNLDPVQKSVKITLTQEDSGKTVEINKVIKPCVKPIYTFDVENTEGNRYVVTSLVNQSEFVDFNVEVAGEGSRLVRVIRDERRNNLLRVLIGMNIGDTDLPYVITLTQNESGKKIEIKGVLKGVIRPDVKVMPEVWKEVVGVSPRYTLRLRWSNYDKMNSYGDQLNVNLSILTPANPNANGGKQIMETTNRHVVLERDNILEMPINSSFGKPEVFIDTFHKFQE